MKTDLRMSYKNREPMQAIRKRNKDQTQHPTCEGGVLRDRSGGQGKLATFSEYVSTFSQSLAVNMLEKQANGLQVH